MMTSDSLRVMYQTPAPLDIKGPIVAYKTNRKDLEGTFHTDDGYRFARLLYIPGNTKMIYPGNLFFSMFSYSQFYLQKFKLGCHENIPDEALSKIFPRDRQTGRSPKCINDLETWRNKSLQMRIASVAEFALLRAAVTENRVCLEDQIFTDTTLEVLNSSETDYSNFNNFAEYKEIIRAFPAIEPAIMLPVIGQDEMRNALEGWLISLETACEELRKVSEDAAHKLEERTEITTINVRDYILGNGLLERIKFDSFTEMQKESARNHHEECQFKKAALDHFVRGLKERSVDDPLPQLGDSSLESLCIMDGVTVFLFGSDLPKK